VRPNSQLLKQRPDRQGTSSPRRERCLEAPSRPKTCLARPEKTRAFHTKYLILQLWAGKLCLFVRILDVAKSRSECTFGDPIFEHSGLFHITPRSDHFFSHKTFKFIFWPLAKSTNHSESIDYLDYQRILSGFGACVREQDSLSPP
jgi:hypothetical protein